MVPIGENFDDETSADDDLDMGDFGEEISRLMVGKEDT